MSDDGAAATSQSVGAERPPDPAVATLANGMLEVPDVRGMAVHEARRLARLSDLHVDVVPRPSEEGLWGRVLGQHPSPGAEVGADETITLLVGARPTADVPDVRGVDEAEFLDALRDLGLLPGRRVVRRTDSVPPGHVVKTRPRAGMGVPQGSTVSYVVAAPRDRERSDGHGRKRGRVYRMPDGSFGRAPTGE